MKESEAVTRKNRINKRLNSKEISTEFLYKSIKSIIKKSRKSVHSAVNTAMVEAYWYIGKTIVEDEQQGKYRAEYGKQVIKDVSNKLSHEFGKGFSVQNLWNMRQFYWKFSSMRIEFKIEKNMDILSSLRRELSWTHYKILLRVEKSKACFWYMNEAADQVAAKKNNFALKMEKIPFTMN